MSTATSTNLEHFLDTFVSATAALKNVKLDNLADFIFLYIAQKKLDSETVRLFELNKRSTEIPLYDDFVSFLREHIKILQRTSRKHEVLKSSERKTDTAFKSLRPPKQTHTYLATATAPAQPLCSLCNSQHEHLYTCSIFRNMSANDRFKFVKVNSKCVNCLGNHRFSACRSNARCRQCNLPHHSMLHFEDSASAFSASSHYASANSAFANSASSYFASANSAAANSAFANSASANPASAHSATANFASTPSYSASANSAPANSASANSASRGTAPQTAQDVAGRPAAKTSSAVINTNRFKASTARTDDVALCSLSNCANSRAPTTVLLATARVVVFDSRGKEHSVRALLDSASQSNFVSRNLCQRLGLEEAQNTICSVVKGIGGTTEPIQGSISVKFFSRFDLSVCFDMDSLVVDKVTEHLPTVTIDTSTLVNFQNVPLADDTYSIPGDIDLLIGASIFPHLLLSRKIQGQSDCLSPLALETVLGYVIVGSAPARVDSYTSVSYCCTSDPLDAAVHKFWQIEELNVPQPLSPDDTACEDIYTNTTIRESDGRYVVALPFKGDVSSLGDSFNKAKTRFLCLERKMQASPMLKEAYDNVITEYMEKGYISPAPPDTEATKSLPSYTIPHHGVIREDKVTSKLRVVLDASSKTTSQVSLNDILYNGQNLQGNLFHIIANFRLYRIALSADIRQMFLCIGVRPCDRKFQRILYRFSPQEPLKVYEFNRVCFGLKSSPFHALRTVKQLLSDEGASYPRAKETVNTGLYMDDFVYSVDSEEDAISTAAEVIALMTSGQFDLVKWTSNSQGVLNSIPPSHRLSSVKEFDDSESHKVLGLCWSPATDNFSLKISMPAESCTKRTILSCIARIWDVMGFVAPVVLYPKLIIKQLWLCERHWGDVPPEHIVQLWARFKEELPLLTQISPRKVVSLPRLELCAIFLLSSLITKLIEACNNRINIYRVFAFSDLTVALCWVHSSPHRWDTFVANRVTKIQNEFPAPTSFHVPGTENPADCLSRGLCPKQIIDHPLSFCGPIWILSDPHFWPVTAFNPSTVSHITLNAAMLLAASHFGGNWETNIKSLKTHLFRVIGDQILSFEEFSTVLAQIEAVLNSRPLCRTLSNDPSEPLALTPSHFLTLTPLKYLPAREIEEGPLHLLSRYELIDKLVQSFWKRWKADYLHTLQMRNKWNTPTNPIAKGDVVIVIVDNSPPLHWPLGLVEEVFPGSNGVTRVVRVRTATGSYLRPVVRICPLPNT